MIDIRRIVTGHDGQGHSIVISDARHHVPFQSLPGFANTLLWASDGVPQVGVPGAADPVGAVASFVPAPGGTRLMLVTVPPDSAMASPSFDGAAYAQELVQKAPGFLEVFEPDAPGMHTTDTLDYGVLLDGEVWLELDDGQAVKLGQHDLVVQNGTRHAWRNRSDRPATLLFVLLGARRG
ncbi:MAG: cupin domain-containing protein [Comamonadaceae bacterium]|nr:MAG: cupin domain-containing protein [Comamonadaceae bacterium]